MKKKLLIILPSRHSLPPTTNCSGISWLLHDLNNELDKFDVTSLSFYKGDISNKIININYQPKYAKEGILFRVLKELITILPYRVKQVVFYSSNADKITRCLVLSLMAKHQKADVIIGHVYPTLIRTLYLVGVKKIPVIFYYHGSDYNGIAKNIQMFLKKYSSGLIKISSEQISPEIFNKPIGTILNAVNINLHDDEVSIPDHLKSRLNISRNDFPVIYAGVIEPNKGLDFLVKAVISIIETYPSLKMFIVGKIPEKDSPNFEYYSKLKILSKGHLDNIYFLGFIPHKELIQLYPLFKLGILLSQKMEGNSLFLMECITSGVPVIGTKIGGIPDVIDNGETGLLIESPQNIEEIKSKIKFVIENQESYEKMRRNSLQKGKEKFSFSRAGRQLTYFLENSLRLL